MAWIMTKGELEEGEVESAEDDPPLVDGEHAGPFAGAFANYMKDKEGEAKALQAFKAASLDPRKLYPEWAGDAAPKIEKVGLSWLL